MLNEELLAVNQDTAGRQNGRLRPPALPRPATEGRLEVATAKWKGRGSKDPVSEDTLPRSLPHCVSYQARIHHRYRHCFHL